MARTSIIIGTLLTLLGVGFYVGLMLAEGEAPSATSLIPAFFGVPILALGAVALNESARMHAMHVVAILALLGTLAPLGRLGMQLAKGAAVPATTLTSLLLMTALCGVLLAGCVRSFIDARRKRVSS
jgi:hypothetical protein